MSENENGENIADETVTEDKTADTTEEVVTPTGETESSVESSGASEAAATSPYKGFAAKLDKFFGISKAGSTFKVEVIAGLTTFMAMVYILMVNAGMFSNEWIGITYGAAYIATAIGAIAGTLLMALLARMPLAQASGMGINAYIVYTLLLNIPGLTYANAMVFVLIDGVIFLVLTLTGLRQKIFEGIPKAVRYAIPVGIGLFIAFIGFQQAGVIVNDDSTLVKFVSFDLITASKDATGNAFLGYVGGNVVGMLPAMVSIVGVIAVAVMSKKNVKGSILWGILGSTALYYIMLGIAYGCGNVAASSIFSSIKIESPAIAFQDWGNQSVGQVFANGFNFDKFFAKGGNGGTLAVTLITSALSLCMIDMFDTIGTLYGACAKGNLLDKDGTPINMNKMMMSDAIATCTGAIAGTSTVTTFVESSSGVAVGGKTGFTSLVTAGCFIIAMFLSPITQLIPRCATAPALIWVGVLMMTSVTKIEWSDAAEAIVAFFTLIVMVLGYSIAKGIGMGIIVYIIVKLCTGKVKEIKIPTWVIGVLFIAMFLLT